MAIGLSDVKERNVGKKSSNNNPLPIHMELTDIQDDPNLSGDEEADKLDPKLKPWESFDKRGLQTRTIAAREAVKKAQAIIKRNQTFSDDLQKRFTKKLTINGKL